jgi:parallel beta-helix repeat protein
MKGIEEHVPLFILTLLIAFAAILAICVTESAEARTITVRSDGSGEFTVIQDALDASVQGDTVDVGEGTFNETIVVERSIFLKGVGTGQTIVNANGSGDAATIRGQNIQVSGMAFIGAGETDRKTGSGILITNHSVTLSNIRTEHNSIGINIHRGNLTLIQGSTIANNSMDGIRITAGYRPFITGNHIFNNLGTGIFVQYSMDAVIAENTIETTSFGYIIYPGRGIELKESVRITVSKNSFMNCGIGITSDIPEHWYSHSIDALNVIGTEEKPIRYLTKEFGGDFDWEAGQLIIANCTDLLIRDTVLSNVSTGAIIAFSRNVTLQNSTCYFTDTAIFIKGSAECRVIESTIYVSHDNGVILEGSFGTSITDNLFGLIGMRYNPGIARGSSILLRDSHLNWIRNNTFHMCKSHGIELQESTWNVLNRNRVQQSQGTGIIIASGSDSNELKNNDIDGSRLGGLLISGGSDENTVSDDLYSGNSFGISILDSHRTIITGTNISGNGIGVQMGKGTADVILSWCDLSMNGIGLSIEGNISGLDATNNSWGHDSGPFHDELNPGAKGDSIEMDDIDATVNFKPWRDSNGDALYTYDPDDGGDDKDTEELRMLIGALLILFMMLLVVVESRPPIKY